MNFDSFAFPLPTSPAAVAEESVQPAPEMAAAEGEIVDELFQILVECLERVGTRSREHLLRKFIEEIGKGAALEETLCWRGVVTDSPAPNKLQRFKVKKPNLDLDSVDKDEPEENTDGKPA